MPNLIPDETLDNWEALCAAATPGPWTCDERTGIVVVYPGTKINGCFVDQDIFISRFNGVWHGNKWELRDVDVATCRLVAASRTALPELIAAYRELKKQVEWQAVNPSPTEETLQTDH